MGSDYDVEIGWSPTSKPHVIEKYPSGKPKTACGRVLSGLADTLHVDVREIDKDVCERCQRSPFVKAAIKAARFNEPVRFTEPEQDVIEIADDDGTTTRWPWPAGKTMLGNTGFVGVFEGLHEQRKREQDAGQVRKAGE